MRRLPFCIVGTVLAFAVLSAQPDTLWARIYDDTVQHGDEAKAVAVDDSGSVYVAGHSHGVGTDEAFLAIKYRPNGETAWVRTWNPTSAMDEAGAMVLDHAGNAVLTGYCGGTSEGGDWATVKFSPAGESLWAQTYSVGSQDQAVTLAVDDSNDVYVVGELGAVLNFSYGVVKYGPTGETLWTHEYRFPSASTQMPSAAALDHHGNLLVTGFSTATDRRAATIKYTPQGDTAWTRVSDGPQHRGADGGAIAVDADDNVYVAGTAEDSSGYQHYLDVKYDAEGNVLWTRTGGPDSEDVGISAAATDRSGSLVATGSCGVNRGAFFDISTAEIRPDGDTLWTSLYNGTGYGSDVGRALAVDSAGNVYVAGQSLGNGTGYNAVTLKYDSLGHLLWVDRFPGPSNWIDARAVALGPAGTVAVTGKTSTPDGYGGALTILYGASGAVEERLTPHASRLTPEATIVHGALKLDRPWVKGHGSCVLLDAAGRKVADLHVGVNDVSRLAPGVYFVSARGAAAAVRVVIAR